LPPRETLKGKIKEVQRLLADLGYPIGQADGIVGPKTRAAVKAFQRKEGLAGDGEVSEQLLAQLRRAGERR
jgi:membrane-bound lytic murein transglycosylase B